MSRRDRGRDLAAHHVRESADECVIETVPYAAKKHVGEKSSQKNVDDEAPRHCDVGGHDHPQQESRVENVAVHRGDVRHAAKEVRIPEREMPGCPQCCRSELTKSVASDVLIAVRIDEEPA